VALVLFRGVVRTASEVRAFFALAEGEIIVEEAQERCESLLTIHDIGNLRILSFGAK
jgi:hypothetical protein